MSRASGDPRLGRVIARWRLTEAERRAAVDVLEPEPRPGGPRLGPLSMDGAAATLVVAGGALAWATGAEGDLGGLGALALLGGVSLALARLLAVLTGRRRRRRLLAGPLEVLVGTDGVERFGEVARPWRGPGVRLEGAAPAEVGGLLFLEIEHSFLSGRGSTQGQRLRAKTLVPVPAGQAADADGLLLGEGNLRLTISAAPPQAPAATGPGATAAASGPGAAADHPLAGRWSINANDYLGTLELVPGAGGLEGTLTLGRWQPEPLQGLTFDGSLLRFTRPLEPPYTQVYQGRLVVQNGKARLEGSFVQGTDPTEYRWHAERREPAP